MPVRVQQQLLNHFVAGTTARAAAKAVGVQGRTAVVFFQRLRQLIASKRESVVLPSEIESHESCWGRGRKERRGREAAREVFVVGLVMRGDKVYTAIIPDAKTKPVVPVIQENVTPHSIIYVNSSQVCDVLDVSEFQYKCVKPSKTVLSRRGYHIDGIENFWNESKRYLRRFNGIPKKSFHCFLKECEWRFNESDHHALSEQLKYWYQERINKS